MVSQVRRFEMVAKKGPSVYMPLTLDMTLSSGIDVHLDAEDILNVVHALACARRLLVVIEDINEFSHCDKAAFLPGFVTLSTKGKTVQGLTLEADLEDMEFTVEPGDEDEDDSESEGSEKD